MCFFFLLVIEFYILILEIIAKIFSPIVELITPLEIATKEETAEIEIHK